MFRLLGDVVVDPTNFALDNPLVFGPLGAFIFVVFVTEFVVSGKAYRREVEENQRLRALTERVVPLAEQMLLAVSDIVSVTSEASRVLDKVSEYLAEERGARRGGR